MWRTCVTLALLMCVHVCAHVPLYPRIMGGADAQRNWPWIVSLHNLTCHFCGGSLISSQWVLSAAHCFAENGYNVPEDTIRVYLGKLTQRGTNNNEIVRNVISIHIHNGYDRLTDNKDNDIALLYLSDKVSFNDHISPVCLIARGRDFPTDTRSRIIGWGEIAPGVNVPYPGTLQEAEVFVVDHNQCQNNLTQCINRLIQRGIQTNLQVTDNMICAGVPGGGVDTYKGDSGGPMMSQHCSKWVQFGITSWGIGCGLPNRPGVYTQVSRYQEWITDTIRNHPSNDFPQFVDLNLQCPSPAAGSRKSKWCCCF